VVTARLTINGSLPPDERTLHDLAALCDLAEDHRGPGIVVLHVSGAPAASWSADLTVTLINKWERALRRFERLPMATVALASGDCGGTALDALLATDYRIATADTRLVITVGSGATWPGMALYRLANQSATAYVRRAALFGRALGATEALAARLIDELAEDGDGALAEAVTALSGFSGPDLAIRRQLMFDAGTVAFEDALGSHLAACDRALRQTVAEAVL
jgi:isomerase DpgB